MIGAYNKPYPFVTQSVTQRLAATTHCHHNLGYYFGKRLIPCVVISGQTGLRYALESKVVYSR
jgi:hypothetical protein